MTSRVQNRLKGCRSDGDNLNDGDAFNVGGLMEVESREPRRGVCE